MRRRFAMLGAAICAASAFAQPGLPDKPGERLTPPGDPGMRTPVDPGAVVEPPRTGNEDIVKVPKRVDPSIDDATPELDRRNRRKHEKREEKMKKAE